MVTLNIDDAKNEFDSLVRRCIKNNDIIRFPPLMEMQFSLVRVTTITSLNQLI